MSSLLLKQLFRALLLFSLYFLMLAPKKAVAQCSATSPVYGIGSDFKSIVTVNTSTGVLSAPLTTIPSGGSYTAMGINPNTGVLFYIANFVGTGSASALAYYNPVTNTHTNIGTVNFPAGTNINKGAVVPDGKFYFSGGDKLYVYDPAQPLTTGIGTAPNVPTATTNPKLIGALTVSGLTAAEMAGGDIAFDGFGNMWVVFKAGSSTAIRVVQFPAVGSSVGTTGSVKINQTIPSALAGIAFDAAGDMYLGSMAGLFKADTDAGTLTAIGPSTAANHYTVDLASCFLPFPNVAVSKSVSPSGSVSPGDILTYTITVTNTGNLRADNVTLVDALPTGVDYVPNSVTLNGTNTGAATYPYTSPGTMVNGPSQIAGALTSAAGTAPTATIRFQVKVKNPYPYTNPPQVINQGSITYTGKTTAVLTPAVTNIVCPKITSPQNVTVCEGDSPNLTVTTSASGTNVIKYVKFNSPQTSVAAIYGGSSVGSATPNASSVATLAGATANFPASGSSAATYYVYAILDPAPSNDANCRPFAEIKVVVNPKSNTPTIDNNPSPICVGQSATLNGSGCPAGTSYLWNTGATTASIMVTPATTTTYSLQCKDNTTGCLGNVSGSVTLTVNPKPAPPTLTSSSSSVCVGASATITAAGCSGTVKWSNGAESVSSITVSPTANTTYTATCTSTSTTCVSDASNAVAITVNPKPSPPVLSPSTETICSGTSTTLSATGCAGTVTWNTGATGANLTVTPLSTATYSATCKDNLTGCVSDLSNTSTITVVIPPPTPSVSATKTVICSGESTTLTINNCTGTPSWNTGETTASITVSPTATATYTGKCSVSGGVGVSAVVCSTPALTTLTITVNPTPAPPAITIAPSTICEGESSTLTATGCTGTVKWSNGQTGASVTVSPVAGNYTYTATCLLATGCESGKSNPVTLTVNPKPKAPVVSASSTSICLGKSSTLTAEGCSGTVTWAGSSTGTGATLVVTPTVDSKYTATCTTAAGCKSDASTEVTVAVILLPTAPIISTKTPAICVGNSTQLEATGCTGTVTWSDGQKAASITVNPTATTTYTATCTNTTSGCESVKSNAITITVNAVPTVKAGVNSPVCEGQTVNLTLTPSGGTAPYTYSWTNGGTYSSTAQNPTFGATLGSTGTYQVTVTDKNGCKAVDNVALQVNQNPSVKIQPVNAFCEGETVLLSTETSGGSGSYNYSWTGPNGFTGKDATATINSSTPAATGTYIVTVTDAKTGCTADYKIAVVVNERPKLTASANSPICEGQQIILTSAATGGSGSYSYAWAGPNTFTSPQQNPTLTATLSAAGTYTITVTDTKTNCLVSAKVSVEVYEIPVVKKTTPQIFCEGDKTKLTADVSSGSGSYSYSWTGPAGFTSVDVNPVITVTPATAGNYTVTITDTKTGCKVSATCEIKVNEKLTITIGGTKNICEGQAINLTASATAGSGTYTYAWEGPNGFTSATQNPTLAGTVEASGTYTVTVTDEKTACKYQATIDVKVNPAFAVAATSTNAKCNGSKDGTANVTVTGGTVPFTYLWNDGSTNQNRTGLAAGTYTVTVKDASNICTGTATVTITEPAALAATAVGTNLKCNKDNSGKIDLTVTGGTKPYSYLWSNGDNIEDLTGLAAASYSVAITDANGCKTTSSATVAEPAPMIIIGIQTNVKCYGGTEGTATHTGTSGGTAPYTFLWNDGATTKDRTGLKAASYTVTMTDQNGCVAKGGFNITQPELLTIDLVPLEIQCNGSSTTVTASVKGGTAPYTYAWSNGSTSPSTAGLPAGNYTLTVTDANDCKATKNITVTQPSAIAAGFTKKDVICNGGNTASIEVGASGGTGAITYTWSDGATGAVRKNLTAGNYSVTVKDANNCEVKLDAVITQPTKLTASAVATAVKCFGTTTGSVDLTVSAGTPTYAYAWTNGAAFEDITNVPAGTYTAIVTDANGCQTTATATVTQPAELKCTATQTNAKCEGSKDGSIDITPTGGTKPYNYSWSSGQTTEDISGLGAGTYTVTITDANGCKEIKQIIITEPKTLVITSTLTEIKCNGNKSGAIALAIAGGTTPYTFLWNDGNTDQNRTGLDVGTYTVTVTDAQGCKKTETFTLTQPDVLALTTTSNNLTCNKANDGSIDLTIVGGKAPFKIEWNDAQTLEDRENLAAGTYTVTVIDANGCKATKQVIITQPDALVLTSTTINVKCNADKTGAIDLTVTGGTTPYKYIWNNGGAVLTGAVLTATTEDLSGLAAGSYSVTVRDANGCPEKLNVEINEQTKIIADCVKKDLLCNADNSGSINLIVSGGLAPYTFAWNNAKTTEDLTGLAAGTYKVVINDANGCVLEKETILEEPAVLKVDVTKKDLACNADKSGSITLAVTGGSSPYKYAWADGSASQNRVDLSAATYKVTITDINGCTLKKDITTTEPAVLVATIAQTDILCNGNNTGKIDLTVTGGTTAYTYTWSNGSDTEDINSLLAGTYSVIITDAQGCELKKTATLTEPAALDVVAVATDAKCKGNADGKVDLTVTGGVTPYTFAWSNSATTEDLIGVKAGTYEVTVTDKNGCTAKARAVIEEPAVLELKLVKDTVLCAGGSSGTVLSQVSGGTADYTFLWSNGSTQSTVNGLPSGTYTLTVTDKQGCKVSNSTTLNAPAVLSPSAKIVDVNCNSGKDGSIDLEVAGGAMPYKYLWNNGGSVLTGSVLTATTQDLRGVSAGNYSVTITDNNGCVLTIDFTVKQPAGSLLVEETHQNLSCKDSKNGSITLTVSGGTSPYEYLWSNSQTTQNLTALESGTYSLTVTDVQGCRFKKDIVITEPDVLKADYLAKNLKCNADKSGSIDLTVTGGTAPYKFEWSNNKITEDLTDLSAGTYKVTITDANGCTLKKEFTLIEPDVLAFTYTKKDILCNAPTTGSIDLSVTGGTEPYEYLWSNTETVQNLTGLSAGSYTVTVTDANGCKKTLTIKLDEPKNCTKPTGTISGRLFVDKDNSNTQTVADVPGVGVKVYLLDSLGNKIDSTFSDGQGKYSFTAPVGTYSLQIVAPVGQGFVTPQSGTDPTKDSDVNIIGKSSPITLSTTNSNQVIDGGITAPTCPATITIMLAVCSENSYSVKVQTSGGTFAASHGTVSNLGGGVYFVKDIPASAVNPILAVTSQDGCKATQKVDKTICAANLKPCPALLAGPNANICGKTDMYQLPKPKADGYWLVASGNAAPTTIDASYKVTGMNKDGVYNFVMVVLSDNCVDTLTITRLPLPSYEVSTVAATCTNNATSNNNGKIIITNFGNNLKYDVVEGSTYIGTVNYVAAKAIPVSGILSDKLSNPSSAKSYTIRVFNDKGCYKDTTVLLDYIDCQCGPQPCLPLMMKRKRAK